MSRRRSVRATSVHMEVRYMGKVLKVFLKIALILSAVVGVLFAVYFWNLDQKVLGWAYVQVNKIFDRKQTDIKF